jgi:hypothetical protein
MAAKDETQPYVKRRKKKIIAWFFFGIGGTGCLILGILAFLGQTSGNFSIKLNETDQAQLAMATASDFNDGSSTSYLRAEGLTSADVMAADILPEDAQLDSDVGGSKNGPNYLAYTFYIKNTSTEKVSYNVSVNIDDYRSPYNQAVSLIAILRLRVYENLEISDTINHNMTTYGKSSSTPFVKDDGTTEYRDPISLCSVLADGTKILPTDISGNMKAENVGWAEPFVSNNIACSRQYSDLAKNGIVRYTVVMWLEGNDPDCIGQEPQGSSVTFSMHFTAIQQVG